MRAAKMLCASKNKKPVAMKSGGRTKSKITKSKGTKGFKGIQPLKPTRMRANKYNSGGSANLKTGSKKMAELQKTKSGLQTQFNAPFASASPAEAREERQKANRRDRAENRKLKAMPGGDFKRMAKAPLKKEKEKDAKRVADIKRRQKTESAVRKKKSEISRKGRGGGGGRSSKATSALGIKSPVVEIDLSPKLKRLKSWGKTKSRVNEAGNYTKPTMRKRLFNRIKAGGKGGAPGQWSARKAQMLASAYKKAGGGYRN